MLPSADQHVTQDAFDLSPAPRQMPRSRAPIAGLECLTVRRPSEVLGNFLGNNCRRTGTT